MDTLSLKCTATEVTDKERGAEVALSPPSQSDHQASCLGVPVENALTLEDILSPSFSPAPNQKWFYMHAGFGKNRKAQEAFSSEKIFTYIPEETIIVRNPDGTKIKKRKPIFTSYLFVLATHEQVKAFTNTGDTQYSLPFLHFVYNKTDKNALGGCSCMTIRHSAMVNFINLAKIDTPKVHTVDINKVRFVNDAPVIITEGAFKGIIGRVARIHNQTTVVVTLEGVASMTTAYIPKHFMKPYNEK